MDGPRPVPVTILLQNWRRGDDAALGQIAEMVDHTRRHRSAKRGAGITPVSLDDAQAASEPRSVDLLALDEALSKLAEVDARKARAMELKFFGGLQMAEIAAVLNISIKTVEKDVRLGAAFLRSALGAAPPA